MTKDYTQYFDWKKRITEKAYVTLRDDAPKELQQLIYHIHDDIFQSLPNDWIYEVIYEAFDALSRDKLEDIIIGSDYYNSSLYEWLGYSFAAGFCDDIIECSDKLETIYSIISRGQHHAKAFIYDAVDHFINNEEQHDTNM